VPLTEAVEDRLDRRRQGFGQAGPQRLPEPLSCPGGKGREPPEIHGELRRRLTAAEAAEPGTRGGLGLGIAQGAEVADKGAEVGKKTAKGAKSAGNWFTRAFNKIF
jgi:hypothetical protein